ncbi:MAG: helix-turn-helix transcriptional regulator [Erysipelotrichaceae bacterium]|nr:helix-turn-helix transcriptional regulator [Erysipelotrichaceae bacterium]
MSDKIYKLRKGLNLSQDEFGAMLSVSRQAVSKWELGQSMPDIEILRKIKQLFNVSYDELIDNDQPVEHNNDIIFTLRRKQQFFYYSVLFIIVGLALFLFYVFIRLNGYYDAFIFNSELKSIHFQEGYDWFYYFIKLGLLVFSGLSILFGSWFVYLSQKDHR